MSFYLMINFNFIGRDHNKQDNLLKDLKWEHLQRSYLKDPSQDKRSIKTLIVRSKDMTFKKSKKKT
jgi:hypothetical protein